MLTDGSSPGGLTALLWALALATLVGVPIYARVARGRTFAIFGAVILALSLSGALATEARLSLWVAESLRPWVTVLWLYGVAASGAHLVHLVRARLRSRVYRVLVSAPGQAFIAAGFLAGPWQLLVWPPRAIATWLDWALVVDVLHWLDLLPFALAAVSIPTSLRASAEWVRVHLAADGPTEFQRVPVARTRARPQANGESILRIVQIADPHLGPWQSVGSLRDIIGELLEHEPDLVLLTGDFLTMEGQGTPGALAEALSPLRPVSSRCYAIFGNHDHEAPAEVRSALASNGVRLLVDEEVIAPTVHGPVQLIGADYVGRGRSEHIAGLLERFPRRDGHPRLLLLHDPLGFHDVPVGGADLTLSGHTHGGQLGLLSLGLDWTVLSRSRWPDHGLFARGSNRLYVHRGTGFYGFPLRIGVPGEASVMELVLQR